MGKKATIPYYPEEDIVHTGWHFGLWISGFSNLYGGLWSSTSRRVDELGSKGRRTAVPLRLGQMACIYCSFLLFSCLPVKNEILRRKRCQQGKHSSPTTSYKNDLFELAQVYDSIREWHAIVRIFSHQLPSNAFHLHCKRVTSRMTRYLMQRFPISPRIIQLACSKAFIRGFTPYLWSKPVVSDSSTASRSCVFASRHGVGLAQYRLGRAIVANHNLTDSFCLVSALMSLHCNTVLECQLWQVVRCPALKLYMDWVICQHQQIERYAAHFWSTRDSLAPSE